MANKHFNSLIQQLDVLESRYLKMESGFDEKDCIQSQYAFADSSLIVVFPSIPPQLLPSNISVSQLLAEYVSHSSFLGWETYNHIVNMSPSKIRQKGIKGLVFSIFLIRWMNANNQPLFSVCRTEHFNVLCFMSPTSEIHYPHLCMSGGVGRSTLDSTTTLFRMGLYIIEQLSKGKGDNVLRMGSKGRIGLLMGDNDMGIKGDIGFKIKMIVGIVLFSFKIIPFSRRMCN